MKENTAKKATCCHKCGRVHVKGTACKRPYLTGKDSCAVNEVQDLKEFFSKPLEEVKTDEYGNHIEPQFKIGDKIKYLGHPGEVVNVESRAGKYTYNVTYDKGQGLTKASNIFNKGGELKLAENTLEENHQGKTEEELKSYIKGLMKDRSSAASKGQDGLVSGINKEIKQLAKELKKRETAITEAKKMTLGNYLDDLDSRFVDFMRAADGRNAEGSQGIDMLATINHNFNLFRNYISSLKKEYSSELNKELTFSIDEVKEEDKVDTITMEIPLFIRMLEYSREDAAEDMDLHDVTEKAISLGKERGILSMEDYEEIVGATEKVNEVNLKQAKLSSAEYQKAKKLKDFKASDWKWNADEDLYTKNDYFAKRKVEMGDEAKIDVLQRFRRGEIDTLPEDPREDMINRMMREVKNKKGGLWANINAKRARGGKPSHGNSKAFKDAVKAGEELEKTKK